LNEKENGKSIENTSEHNVRNGSSNYKSTVLKRLYCIMGFTKGNNRQKTHNDIIDNFTVRENLITTIATKRYLLTAIATHNSKTSIEEYRNRAKNQVSTQKLYITKA
jgi:hypothetical protein